MGFFQKKRTHLLALLLSLFSLFTLFVPLAQAYGLGESGFGMLDFRSTFLYGHSRAGEICFGTLLWVHLIGAVTFVVLSFASFFLADETAHRLHIAAAVGALVFAALYLMQGIMIATIANAARGSDVIVTYSFIPLIFTAEIAALLFVVDAKSRKS